MSYKVGVCVCVCIAIDNNEDIDIKEIIYELCKAIIATATGGVAPSITCAS